MKEIAEYALIHEPSKNEEEKLKGQLNVLQGVIFLLKRHLYSVIH
jgi:sorbitol-specific phosphotransferase system component IIA